MRTRDERAYAGIGSRRTPEDVLGLMRNLAWDLVPLGYKLRSGGAEGADTAFEEGALLGGQLPEVYLPWPGFNGHVGKVYLSEPKRAAYKISEKYHPNWSALSDGAKRLHARNAHQVLGLKLDDPVDFVVCWTPDGSLDGRGPRTGGTGQALRIASAHDVEVINLKLDSHRASAFAIVEP